MSSTKVLQINPQLFQTVKKDGKNNTFKIKEKKQKPEGYKGPSTLRKALLGKIRDFQKKNQENGQLESHTKTSETKEEFNTEFNKSLDFLQELSKRHNNTIKTKKENKIKNKTLKQSLNGNQPIVNLELPKEFTEDAGHTPFQKNISMYITRNGGQSLTNVEIIPQAIPQIQILKPLPIIHNQITQLPIVSNDVKNNIIKEENNNQNNSDKIKSVEPIQENSNETKENHETINETIVKNEANSNYLKNPPPYSNLKGGNKPSYKEWSRHTQKKSRYNSNQSITIEDNQSKPDEKKERDKTLEDVKLKYKQNHEHKKSLKQLVKVKTRTIKYNLGKKGKTVGILIKNRHTRKRIKDEHALLKQKTLADVKDFLREKNLIKAGTIAPTDVLRTLYEQSILTGDVVNKSKDTLIHNFVSS